MVFCVLSNCLFELVLTISTKFFELSELLFFKNILLINLSSSVFFCDNIFVNLFLIDSKPSSDEESEVEESSESDDDSFYSIIP